MPQAAFSRPGLEARDIGNHHLQRRYGCDCLGSVSVSLAKMGLLDWVIG